MKVFFYNLGYFLKEALRIIRFQPLSNLFSVIGTALILFLLGLVLAGWSIGDKLVTSLEEEAAVSAYFADNIKEEQALQLTDQIKAMEGVLTATYQNEEEAYELNKKLLGNEAEILSLFEENPFEAFIDIRIELDSMDTILQQVSDLEGIEYVRDNREILERLKGIVSAVKLLGILIAMAVAITTLMIISHMIRQGIYNNKEQIRTLRLLGAPGSFIGLPFVLTGTLLTVIGGLGSAIFLSYLLTKGYGELSGYLMFLPFPPMEELREWISSIIVLVSLALGFFGSLFGLTSISKSD
ncbi:MAG: permease-like cell division protein FtsX [Mobilitalea sp.]